MNYFTNFLSQAELKIVRELLDDAAWRFGYTSNDPNKPIWNFHKTKAGKIAEIVANKLIDYELVDYHINGQTIGLTADIHVDVNCTHAFVFFPNKWKYVWGGRLHIFTDQGPQVVNPQENFGVLFDASLPHYAEAPVENILRISIGLKLRKKNGTA
jgi:hypothetical protein